MPLKKKIILCRNFDPSISKKIRTFLCSIKHFSSEILKIKIPKPLLKLIIDLFLQPPQDSLMHRIWSSNDREAEAREVTIEILTEHSPAEWNSISYENEIRKHKKIISYVEELRKKFNSWESK